MSRSSILAIEFYCRGQSHVPFNLGYLATLRAAYPDKEINFYAEKNHIEALKANGVASLDVSLHIAPTHVSITNPDSSLYARELSAYRCISFMLAAIKRYDASFVATFGVTPDLLRAIRRKWTKNYPHLDIVLHAPLMFLDQWRSKNPMRRFLDFPSEMSKRMAPNVRFVTLESAIRDKLIERMPQRLSDTIVLEHPVNTNLQLTSTQNCERKSPTSFRVGFLGVASEAKGFSMFLELANLYASDTMTFHAIGRAGADWSDNKGSCLTTKPAKEMISREEFLIALKSLNIVVLPLEKQFYDWISSGTLLDCIEHNIPVIISTNNIIKDIEKRFGMIGIVCEKKEDFFSFFKNSPVAVIENMKDSCFENMARIRSIRSPKNLSKSYPGFIL